MPQNGVLPAQAQSIFFKEKQNKKNRIYTGDVLCFSELKLYQKRSSSPTAENKILMNYLKPTGGK